MLLENNGEIIQERMKIQSQAEINAVVDVTGALFIMTLPKAHLTSQSRMSGSRSVITPSQRGC